MAHWGIETFFSISTTTAEHTPEIAGNLFVWPNFIDSDIYRDHGQDKVIPVLFNGNMSSVYPWRKKIYKVVSKCYPSLTFPHLGYESYSPIMIHGEQYARTLNASYFVPACGTLAKEIIRKHFEIPGCRSCLITEKSQSLEAAGFVDMQNCVFADEKDVLDKINYLFQNRAELEKITNAGHQLVHSRHTLKQRDQIFQWFKLNNTIRSDQKIVQLSPFESLSVVERSSGIKNAPIICNGLNLTLLYQGDEKLWAGKYDEAEALYLRCLNYIPWMSEPKLKLAICNLYKGHADNALNWILTPIQNNLSIYKALEPEPVEWAYLIISLLCKGDLTQAMVRAGQFPSLHHPELDRTRWVVNYLQNDGNKVSTQNCQLSNSRYSIHQLPQLSFERWINGLYIMLKICQQANYSEMLSKLLSSKERSSEKPIIRSGYATTLLKKRLRLSRVMYIEKINSAFEAFHIPNRKTGLPSISFKDHIIRLAKWIKIDSLKGPILKYRSYLKDHLKPCDRSASAKLNNDEFSQAVQYLFQQEDIKTAIIIGSSNNAEKAIFTDQKRSDNGQTVFNINNTDGEFVQFKNNHTDHSSSELNNCIKKVKQENDINFFDLVLIDSSEFRTDVELHELKGGRFIILNKINAFQNYKIKQKLISDPSYTIVMDDPSYKNGYTIFKKLDKSLLRDYPSTQKIEK
jgi:hypothetical protein